MPPCRPATAASSASSDAHGNTIELANGQISVTAVGTLQIHAPNVIINGRVVAPVGPPI